MNDGLKVYEELAAYVLKQTEAQHVVVIVLDGKHGSGFSVNSLSPTGHLWLPNVLRKAAADIENHGTG